MATGTPLACTTRYPIPVDCLRKPRSTRPALRVVLVGDGAPPPATPKDGEVFMNRFNDAVRRTTAAIALVARKPRYAIGATLAVVAACGAITAAAALVGEMPTANVSGSSLQAATSTTAHSPLRPAQKRNPPPQARRSHRPVLPKRRGAPWSRKPTHPIQQPLPTPAPVRVPTPALLPPRQPLIATGMAATTSSTRRPLPQVPAGQSGAPSATAATTARTA